MEASPPDALRFGDPSGTGPPELQALFRLLQAHDAAAAAAVDGSQFAQTFPELITSPEAATALRSLVARGLVRHAREATAGADPRRTLETVPNLAFTAASCFVLTGPGLALARKYWRTDCAATPPAQNGLVVVEQRPWFGRTPRGSRELRYRSDVVKRYWTLAENQELILTAFEEEDWPPYIDDPLPQSADQNPKKRLHDAIRALNRNRLCPVLRFRGTGNGQGVSWEATAG